MSAKSLSKIRHRLTKKSADSEPEARSGRNWLMILLLPLWVTIAYIVSNLIIYVVLWVLSHLGVSPENYLRPAVLQTTLAASVYAITIALVIGIPYAVRKRPTSLKVLGLDRLPSWTDIGLAPVGMIVYLLAYSGLLWLVLQLVPSFPVNQTQDVGFEALGARLDNLLAFATLVVIAPIAEETLFRGYLYGKLKNHIPAIVAALATSLLFAVAHQQLNVGLDVFALSLVLCGLRSLTGSIWAGILLHMLKNGIAYYELFIRPLTGG